MTVPEPDVTILFRCSQKLLSWTARRTLGFKRRLVGGVEVNAVWGFITAAPLSWFGGLSMWHLVTCGEGIGRH